jgi:hypothetical protein
MSINLLNLCSCHIDCCLDNNSLGINATGFIYKYNNYYYLITNWHVVSGQDPETLDNISKTGFRPNKLICNYSRIKKKDNNFTHFKHGDLFINILDKEDNPAWFWHPIYKNKADVVAIPINFYDKRIEGKIGLYAINDLCANNDISWFISQEVFVLGFPNGISYSVDSKKFPIWKKANIATEPTKNYYKEIPSLLIDTATRGGMSGAPVIFCGNQYFDSSGNSIKTCSPEKFFLGVYSGRLGEDEMKSQLGIVWKKELIEEIIKGQEKGRQVFPI